MNGTGLPVILAVCGDAGGAAAVAPVIRAMEKSGRVQVRAFAYREAVKLWEKRNLNFTELKGEASSEIGELFMALSPALVLTGTSVNGIDLEKTFIGAARARGVPSLSVLDFWSNYALRFAGHNGAVEFMPDRIAVMDNRARGEMMAEGFSAAQLVVTGQPAFDELVEHGRGFSPIKRRELRKAWGVLDNDLVVCFASQPLTEVCGTSPDNFRYPGYDELGVLTSLLAALESAAPDFPQRLALVLRPHPREAAGKFAAVSSLYFPVVTEASGDSRDVVLASDLVVGMTTMLLVEAALLGRRTLSLQPGGSGPEFLPTARFGLTPVASHEKDIAPLVKEMLWRARAGPTVPPVAMAPPGATQRVVQLVFELARLAPRALSV